MGYEVHVQGQQLFLSKINTYVNVRLYNKRTHQTESNELNLEIVSFPPFGLFLRLKSQFCASILAGLGIYTEPRQELCHKSRMQWHNGNSGRLLPNYLEVIQSILDSLVRTLFLNLFTS
jgi:hypothetical protein